MLAAISSEVTVVVVDHRDARAHETRDREHGDAGPEREGGVGVALVVVVPTSAQPRICRRSRYADVGWGSRAGRADRGVDVGITRVVLAIVVLLVVGEGGDGDQGSEQG